VHQVGFGNAEVIDAIKRQLDELSFCTRRYTNRNGRGPGPEARRNRARPPPEIPFLPGGAEAVGIALKLGADLHRPAQTISMWTPSTAPPSTPSRSAARPSFAKTWDRPVRHGACAAGRRIPLRLRLRQPRGCDLTCARYIEYILEKEGDIAAVVAEPIRSTPYIPKPNTGRPSPGLRPPRRLAHLRRDPACPGPHRPDVHLRNFGVVPDMVVIGKGLGGGVLPLAAVIARDDLDVAADRALGHYTHEKNPVLCAAALATIDYIEKHALAAHARELGRYTWND